MLFADLSRLILVSGALAIGCSMLVPSELETIHCRDEGVVGPPACEPGYVCQSGTCRACVAGGCGGASGSGGGSGRDGSSGDANLSGASGRAGSAGQDAGAGSGGTAGAPGVGTPCGADADCDDGSGVLFCADNPTILGVSASSGLCTHGCCTSSDCGAGNVCFVSLRGNNLCFVPSVVGRKSPGSVSAGYACSGNSDCRSGICVNGLCVDACCTNSNCGGNLPHCTMRTIPGSDPKEHFYCGKSGTLGLDELCSSSSECQSNYCLASTGRCSIRCCKKSECEAAGSDWECFYIDQTDYAGPRCGPQGPSGMKTLGQACVAGSDCLSGKCLDLGAGSVCTDACCRNDDCGNTSQFGCRPIEISGTGVLLCIEL